MSFFDIKRWYNLKLWTKDMVHKAVELNYITKEQYKDIINEEY
jgi:uncharacterized XkdX family phage protein